jgi:CRISPR-associated protein Cmr4
MTNKAYLITAKSNLHVGAGSSNYGVIDNLVQRDVTDQFPNIFSTSLKGAMREWFEVEKNKEEEAQSIFGNKKGDSSKGSVIFSDAHLLALPVRSNQKPYLMEKFLTIIVEDFKIDIDDSILTVLKYLSSQEVKKETLLLIAEDPKANCTIEDYTNIQRFPESESIVDSVILGVIKTLFGSASLVLFSDEDMKAQCSDYSLPVVARNCLENGQSTNLWYEQIVPRQSCFYFVIEGKTDVCLFTDLAEKPIVQIGANATVGYGRCEVQQLSPKSE